MSDFIPDKRQPAPTEVTFFEDSSSKGIPGRGTDKSIETLQKEITTILLKMNTYNVEFEAGKFGGAPPRYGFKISFQTGGAKGEMKIAALPLRKETPGKKEQALKQALFLVRNSLEAQLNSHHYLPHTVHPLFNYLIDPKTGNTLNAMLLTHGAGFGADLRLLTG